MFVYLVTATKFTTKWKTIIVAIALDMSDSISKDETLSNDHENVNPDPSNCSIWPKALCDYIQIAKTKF